MSPQFQPVTFKTSHKPFSLSNAEQKRDYKLIGSEVKSVDLIEELITVPRTHTRQLNPAPSSGLHRTLPTNTSTKTFRKIHIKTIIFKEMFSTINRQIFNNDLGSTHWRYSDKMPVHFLPLSQQEVVSDVLVTADESGKQLSLS